MKDDTIAILIAVFAALIIGFFATDALSGIDKVEVGIITSKNFIPAHWYHYTVVMNKIHVKKKRWVEDAFSFDCYLRKSDRSVEVSTTRSEYNSKHEADSIPVKTRVGRWTGIRYTNVVTVALPLEE